MKFILFLAKCLVGLLAAIGLLVVASLAVLVYFADSHWELEPKTATIPESNAVLTLDLSAGLVETEPDNPLAQISYGEAVVLPRARELLQAAGNDERISGLILRAGIGEFGMAQAQELRAALDEFRQSGKPILAYAETFGEAGHGTLHYYLASVADEVWMQPSGLLDVTGFSMESLYFREVLDDWGIQPQVSQREEYKGALAFLTDSDLPAPQRQNLSRLLTSALSEMAGEIAASRDMDPAKIRGLIDGAPYAAGEALQAGLLDKLAYWDETGTHFGTDASYLSLKEYADAQDGEDEVDESAVRVALIQGSGPIVLAGNDFGGFADDTAIQANPMAQAISDAIDDPDISAILLRLDSPGGSYVASDTIRREVERAGAEGVPVVVSMGNVAASGGYFIAASAAKIVAQPTTITGSIGVVGGKFVLDGLWRELEIGHASIKAGRNADFWSPNQAFSPEAAASFENLLDRTYNDFMAKVAEGRGLSPEQVHELAKGQVWSGADAKASGLVDALGGFDTALDLIRIEAAIDADAKIRLEAYPAPRDPFTAMIEDFFGASAELGAFAKAVKGIARLAQAMAALDPARHVLSDGQKSLQTRAPEMRLP